MITFISSILGCVYTLIDDELFYTPLNNDGTCSTNEDDFVEVDHIAMLGEEQYIQDEIVRVENILRGNFVTANEH